MATITRTTGTTPPQSPLQIYPISAPQQGVPTNSTESRYSIAPPTARGSARIRVPSSGPRPFSSVLFIAGGDEAPDELNLIQAAAAQLLNSGIKVYLTGLQGLISGSDLIPEVNADNVGALSNFLPRIFRDNPFYLKNLRDGQGPHDVSRLAAAIKKSDVDKIVMLGGLESLSVARQLADQGHSVLGIPVGIEGNLAANVREDEGHIVPISTFGFRSAVKTAIQIAKKQQAAATASNKIIFLELPTKSGWLVREVAKRTGYPYLITEKQMTFEDVEKLSEEMKGGGVVLLPRGLQIFNRSGFQIDLTHIQLEQIKSADDYSLPTPAQHLARYFQAESVVVEPDEIKGGDEAQDKFARRLSRALVHQLFRGTSRQGIAFARGDRPQLIPLDRLTQNSLSQRALQATNARDLADYNSLIHWLHLSPAQVLEGSTQMPQSAAIYDVGNLLDSIPTLHQKELFMDHLQSGLLHYFEAFSERLYAEVDRLKVDATQSLQDNTNFSVADFAQAYSPMVTQFRAIREWKKSWEGLFTRLMGREKSGLLGDRMHDVTNQLQPLIYWYGEVLDGGEESLAFFKEAIMRGEFSPPRNLDEMITQIKNGRYVNLSETTFLHRVEATLLNDRRVHTPTLVKIRDILLELVLNGIKYKHSERESQIDLNVRAVGDHILFDYKDNGLGMSADFLANHFGHAGQREHPEQRSGLGMNSGYGAHGVFAKVSQLSGNIKVTSEPNVGTQIKITIPRASLQSDAQTTALLELNEVAAPRLWADLSAKASGLNFLPPLPFVSASPVLGTAVLLR